MLGFFISWMLEDVVRIDTCVNFSVAKSYDKTQVSHPPQKKFGSDSPVDLQNKFLLLKYFNTIYLECKNISCIFVKQ